MALKNWRLSAAVIVTAAGASASAQVITIQSQNRFIDGVATLVDQGVPTTDGPYHFEAPVGDFGTWAGTLSATATTPNGNEHVDANQTGGFDGVGTIQLFSMQMNFSGGGAPGTSGTGTLTNTFGYTFTVNQASTFTLNGLFGSGLPVVVTFDLTGPGVAIHDTSATGNTIEYQNVTGTMAAGTYTLKLEGTGTIAFTGPGGNGSGAGGNQPLMTLVVTPAGGCYANCDGSTGSPVLTANDFACFLNSYATGESYADCDGVGGLTANDFSCFLNAYATGCT
jgi:hypothetical protein